MRIRSRGGVIGLGGALAALVVGVGIAVGATGTLAPRGCFEDKVAGLGDCAKTAHGLNYAYSVAASRDGRSVYVASRGAPAEGGYLSVFKRDRTTGALTPRGCFADVDGAKAGCRQQAEGLSQTISVAVSRDGKSVYATSGTDSAVARFKRNTTTGALTYKGCVGDVNNPAAIDCNNSITGLINPDYVAVSPDGKSVYATATTASNSLVRFDRGPNGGLSQPAPASGGCFADSGGPAACVDTGGLGVPVAVTVSPDNKSVYVVAVGDDSIVRFDRDTTSGALAFAYCFDDSTVGTDPECDPSADGLEDPQGVAVSPDNKAVAVAAFTDSALALFTRNRTTGSISFRSCIQDDTASGPCGASKHGLYGADAVAFSGDSKSIYVAGWSDNAIARFRRDLTTGAVSYRGCVVEQGSGETCSQKAKGLNSPAGVTVSRDGKSVYTVAATSSAIARFKRTP